MGLQPLRFHHQAARRRRRGRIFLPFQERRRRRPLRAGGLRLRSCPGVQQDRRRRAHYTFTETYPITDIKVPAPAGVGSDTGSGDYSGLLLGVGAEYALDAHWSVKGEYDYINYGSKNIPMYTVTGVYDYTPKISNIENIVKAAVSYRF